MEDATTPKQPLPFMRYWPYVLIAFLYLATSPYHAGLNNPNEMVRVYMTQSLSESGAWSIDGVIRKWGGVDDKAVRDGKLYSSKAPLQSVVGVPAAWAADPILRSLGIPVSKRTITFVLRMLGSITFGLLFAFVLLAWARRRARELGAPADLSTAIGLTLALGTMHYAYSLTFTGHILASLTAGGTYLAVVALSRHAPGSRAATVLALTVGFLGGAAPFAEYPAALVAGPAIVTSLLMAPRWMGTARRFGLFAAGGALPFAFGLWSHLKLWGSPLSTGYSFLENKSYVQVHGEGFFGVGVPKIEALLGSLFSPGTGLFFFSPVLLIGLAAMFLRCRPDRSASAAGEADYQPIRFARALAICGVIAFVLEVLFIGGHRGWRGGWTVGPRYIIPVVPLLGIWLIEALAVPAMRRWIAAFGAVSIACTGFASALYPHLSDVYTNPIASFLIPSYARGEMSYGVAHLIGLEGHVANAVHIIPLLFTMAYVALAGLDEEPPGAPGFFETPTMKRALAVAAAFVLLGAIIAVVPEVNPDAAKAENQRLWGFWEPKTPGLEIAPKRPRRPYPKLLGTARSKLRQATVENLGEGKQKSLSCTYDAKSRSCRYGNEPWQTLKHDVIEFDGMRQSVLFMHPISNRTVRAHFPTPKRAQFALLVYGLSDASVVSTNKSPVEITASQGTQTVGRAVATNLRGLSELPLVLTSTASVSVAIQVVEDGARVFGFDVEFYRKDPRKADAKDGDQR